MSVDDPNRFALLQMSPDDWVIIDTTLDPEDTHRLVACIIEHDGHVEARWFRPVPLPERFATRTDALQALMDAEPATASEPASALA